MALVHPTEVALHGSLHVQKRAEGKSRNRLRASLPTVFLPPLLVEIVLTLLTTYRAYHHPRFHLHTCSISSHAATTQGRRGNGRLRGGRFVALPIVGMAVSRHATLYPLRSHLWYLNGHTLPSAGYPGSLFMSRDDHWSPYYLECILERIFRTFMQSVVVRW